MITATAAQTGAAGIRNIQVAVPDTRAWLAKMTNCHVIRIKIISTRTAAPKSAIRPARGPSMAARKRILMLLRSTMATGMQQATANAATSEPASRTRSMGLAKKKRSKPSAIVITAKQSKAPRPMTASTRASALLTLSAHAIAMTVAFYWPQHRAALWKRRTTDRAF
jgi:hypothetical protein